MNRTKQCTRGEAKQRPCPVLSDFYHIGKIPPAADVMAVCGRAGPQLDIEDLTWPPRFGDDDAEYGADSVSVPCAATAAKSSMLDIVAWLVDSGSPLDIVDRKHTVDCEGFIRDGPPPTRRSRYTYRSCAKSLR